jgi:hypothetical protein
LRDGVGVVINVKLHGWPFFDGTVNQFRTAYLSSKLTDAAVRLRTETM